MVTIEIEYQGDLHCEARHVPTGRLLQTDAPVDNEGRGESYSPTDLVATALGSCILTIMGIYARRHGLDLAGTRLVVEKHMGTEPRRIVRLPVTITVPTALEERHRQALEKAAHHCPVHASLHPDIDKPITIHYGR